MANLNLKGSTFFETPCICYDRSISKFESPPLRNTQQTKAISPLSSLDAGQLFKQRLVLAGKFAKQNLW